MTKTLDIKIPDIGGFDNVPVIEVFVKKGDALKKDAPMLTLESDKATMEVPSPADGTVAEVFIKVGDRVSEGSVVLRLNTSVGAPAAEKVLTPVAGAEKTQGPAKTAPALAAASAAISAANAANTAAGTFNGKADIECEMLVLGAGPGGYSAAFRAADLGMKTVIVERYARLGGVCLNVGCIPSKALLHTAAVIDETRAMAAHGVTFSEPKIDLDKLRAFKDGVVTKLTSGLAMMAKTRKVEVVRGYGHFLDAHHVEVELTNGEGQDKTGEKKVVRFEKAIIAAGSHAIRLPFLPDDPRVVDATGALELKDIPKRMLVIGGGIIGLEMATVYSTLGAGVDIVEMMDNVMAGADADLVKVWQKHNAKRFRNVMLKTRTVSAEATTKGIKVGFDGEQAPKEAQLYDLVLVAVGRRANGDKIDAGKAGLPFDQRAQITVDAQMRTQVPHIFAIGDVVGQPMLAHKAVHEGHVAAEAAHGEKAFFDARQIPSVAYTDPEVAWAGKTEAQCVAEGIAYEKSVFPWAASGRAIANGRDEGHTKLLFDKETKRIIGGAIVGTHAGDLIGEVCLAIEMGANAVDIGKTIHPHPTLCESIGMAAEVFEGTCTDLPPKRR